MDEELKPCEYCGASLPLGVDKKTRQIRSFHFARCEKRPRAPAQPEPAAPLTWEQAVRSTITDPEYAERILALPDNATTEQIRAIRPEPAAPTLTTCNCRWDGEEQVQQCTLHEAHVRAIHEWAERARAAESKAAPTVVEPETWRCFHCNEVFTTVVDAAFHFGYADLEKPACLVDARELRNMELELRRHREEDTDLHRQIHSMEARHRTALMRAEEEGYAKGLRDAATPPRAALSDEQIEDALNKGLCDDSVFTLMTKRQVRLIARAIERAHGIAADRAAQ